jgi:hypothetical protein
MTKGGFPWQRKLTESKMPLASPEIDGAVDGERTILGGSHLFKERRLEAH